MRSSCSLSYDHEFKLKQNLLYLFKESWINLSDVWDIFECHFSTILICRFGSFTDGLSSNKRIVCWKVETTNCKRIFEYIDTCHVANDYCILGWMSSLFFIFATFPCFCEQLNSHPCRALWHIQSSVSKLQDFWPLKIESVSNSTRFPDKIISTSFVWISKLSRESHIVSGMRKFSL